MNVHVRTADIPRQDLVHDDDTRLVSLGRELDFVHSARRELDARDVVYEDCPYYDRHWELRTAINGLEAATDEGLQAKARAVAYAVHHDPEAECDVSGSFRYLAQSLAADVLRLGGGAPDLVAALSRPAREVG